MKPLTLEALLETVAKQTATIEFSGHDRVVTVRQLSAAEGTRVQLAAIGGNENDPDLNHTVEVLIASICITDADYDTNEGREALAKLPRAMIRKIADAVAGLSGADGQVSKN